MKKKQVLCTLLSAAMTTTLLFAGSLNAAADEEKVHITYAQWGNETETAVAQGLAEEFNASQDRIEVEVIKIDHDTYVTKLNSMATAGELPDCAIMSEAGVLGFASTGLLADISDMYEEGEAKPMDATAFMYNGSPVAYGAAHNVLNMYYNIDLLKQVCDSQGLNIEDVTPPASADDAWDWDTFIDIAQKLTVDVNGNNAQSPDFDPDNVDIYGCTINTLPWQLEVWALSNGGGYYSEDGTECTIDSDATVEALQKIADLSSVYHCAPPVTGSANALETSLGSKKVVMATDGTWNVGTFLGPTADFEWGIGVLPYMKEVITIGTGGPNVVFATSEHPEEAMEFVKWYSSPDKNWELISNGTWAPVLESYYTDPEMTDKWINNPNFPDHDMFKSAMVDYSYNHSKSAAWYYVNRTEEFNATLDSAFSAVWAGEQTMAEAIGEYKEELQGIFEEGLAQ